MLDFFNQSLDSFFHKPMTNYETGRRLEYRIRNMFRKNGYFVIRAAQSKPIDLVCIRDGKSVLIECKVGRSWLGPARKRELMEIADKAGAPVVIARRKKRKVELTFLGDGKPFTATGETIVEEIIA